MNKKTGGNLIRLLILIFGIAIGFGLAYLLM